MLDEIFDVFDVFGGAIGAVCDGVEFLADAAGLGSGGEGMSAFWDILFLPGDLAMWGYDGKAAKITLNRAEKQLAKRAGEFIREGGLVVLPTETVYGLGADAFNSSAVARIYSEKGRPADNPLILHIAEAKDFDELVYEPPEYAARLIKAFWPGPLTLVARKSPLLPFWAGGAPDGRTETIGIRMPAHPMAKAIIAAAGCAVAAPSANKAGRPSPTALAHIFEDYPELAGEMTEDEARNRGIMVIDGGNALVGLESTVVDITGERPRILRPGSITAENIQAVTKLDVDTTFPRNASVISGDSGDCPANQENQSAPRSPGMKYKHYAPKAPLTILSGSSEKIAAYLESVASGTTEHDNSSRVGALVTEQTHRLIRGDIPMPVLTAGGDEQSIAQNLFARFRQFDKAGVTQIYAESVPTTGIGAAIMNRMIKAAEGRVINV